MVWGSGGVVGSGGAGLFMVVADEVVRVGGCC